MDAIAKMFNDKELSNGISKISMEALVAGAVCEKTNFKSGQREGVNRAIVLYRNL